MLDYFQYIGGCFKDLFKAILQTIGLLFSAFLFIFAVLGWTYWVFVDPLLGFSVGVPALFIWICTLGFLDKKFGLYDWMKDSDYGY